MQDIGHVVLGTPTHEWQLYVGTKAHGHIGLAFLGKVPHQEPLGPTHAPESRDERPRLRAIKPRHIERGELKARLWHQGALKPTLLPEEAYVMPARGKLLRQGKCLIDVACRTTRSNGNRKLLSHGAQSLPPRREVRPLSLSLALGPRLIRLVPFALSVILSPYLSVSSRDDLTASGVVALPPSMTRKPESLVRRDTEP